ncbi:MAG: PorP/SprF family type IX secretion system membrane protein [Bacteroidota bacterium]
MRQLYTILFIAFSLTVHAQQEVLFSQFFSQKTIANPGAVGSQEVACLSAIHRQQWIGLEGAPTSQAITFDAPVFANRVGLGLTVINDQIGFFNGTYINAAYAYRLHFGNGTLGIGMQGSYRHQRTDWGQAETITQRSDPTAGENMSVPLFNVGAGMHFENDQFFAGVSVPYILEKSFTKKYQGIVDDFSGTTPHLFVNAGWVLPVTADFRLRPAFAARILENAPPNFDLHFSMGFLENSRLWTGATLRWGQSKLASAGDALSLMAQYQINQRLNAGFAYDLSINGLQQQNSGTFELLVGYCFLTDGENVNHPRFFR